MAGFISQRAPGAQLGRVLERATIGCILIAVSLPAVVHATEKSPPDLGAIDRRIDRLERVLSSDRIVDLIQAVSALEMEVRRLRGRIQEHAHRIDELRARQRRLYAELDRRVRHHEIAREYAGEPDATSEGLESPAHRAAEKTGAEAARAARAAAARITGGGTTAGDQPADHARRRGEREAYAAAFELLMAERYGEAISALRRFLTAFPDSAYADDAQYWIGESHYVRGDLRKALGAFRRVTTRFPGSPRVPAAFLKVGYSLARMGDLADAENTLRQLVEEYPGSTSARLARSRLARIQQ